MEKENLADSRQKSSKRGDFQTVMFFREIRTVDLTRLLSIPGEKARTNKQVLQG